MTSIDSVQAGMMASCALLSRYTFTYLLQNLRHLARQRSTLSTNYAAKICSGCTTAFGSAKTPIATEVGLIAGDIVLDDTYRYRQALRAE